MALFVTRHLHQTPVMNSHESHLDEAARLAANYLRKIGTRRVAPSVSEIQALDALSGPLPESSLSPAEVLALVDRIGSPATIATTGGRYFGFVNGGTLPAALAASWLVSAWDQNVSLRVMSPAGAAFEDVALEWAIDVLGLPRTAGGAVVTGAT